MLHNLISELAIKKITKKKLSDETGISQRALYDKMNGRTEFTLDEMLIIRDTFFPDLTLDYLFEIEESA